MRKVTFLHIKGGLSQHKRYTFYKSSLPIFSRYFYKSLIISALQKTQNLGLFSVKKASPLPSPKGKGVTMVNLSNCNLGPSTGDVLPHP